MKKIIKCISLLLLLLMLTGLMTGCGAAEGSNFREPADFEKARIGIMTGSSFDSLAKEFYPEAELFHLNMSDSILNLKQNKLDGILMDTAFFTPLLWEGEPLSYVGMDMPATEYAVALPKTAEAEVLKEQLNEFILTQTENGWLAALAEKWFSATEPVGTYDLSELTGENGTLRVATTVECKPFDYMKDGQFCGLDADFIFRFAKEYGYALEIDPIAFDALLPSLSANRYDLALSGITVTEERKESVYFSDPYCSSPVVMAVLADENRQQPARNNTMIWKISGTRRSVL